MAYPLRSAVEAAAPRRAAPPPRRVSGRAWREDGALRVRLGVMHPMDTGLVSNVARFNIEQLDIRDADNRLLARQSRYRIDAEMVRDGALEMSGLLTPTIGGRSVFPYQPEGYYANCNTFGGVLINEHAQAMSTAGAPIPGLYVAGGATGGPDGIRSHTG